MSLDAYFTATARDLTVAASAGLDQPVTAAIDAIATAFEARRPLLLCGNGGSAADAMHIAGELVGRYKRERPGLMAIALGADAAVTTAWGNDYDFDSIFERQVEALGAERGVVWGLSTSGNSENIVRALAKARAMAMTSIALTGEGGGRLAGEADILIPVPSTDTPRIQELHTCVYHYVCEQVELRMSG